MSDGERYYSVPERITWTAGFRCPIDKHVLGVLSTFASFKTGTRAAMSLAKLMARAQVPRRTLIRSLRRLEADGWVKAWRRHRRPTVYDICVERLAVDWRAGQSLTSTTSQFERPSLGVTGGTQELLSATGDRLSATGGTQEPVLSATGGTPSPVRTIPCTDPQRTGTSPVQLALPPQAVGPEAPRYDASRELAELRAKVATPVSEARSRRRRFRGGAQ